MDVAAFTAFGAAAGLAMPCATGFAAVLVEAKTGAVIIIVDARPRPTRVRKRAIFFTPIIRADADKMNRGVQTGTGGERNTGGGPALDVLFLPPPIQPGHGRDMTIS